MMPGRKTSKRPREEDPDQDSSQPIAKRITLLNLNPEFLVEKSNDSSTAQLTANIGVNNIKGFPISNPPIDDIFPEDFSWPEDVDWQPGSINPCMGIDMPQVYEPEIPAADNPHYYEVNKVLFEAHLSWIQRQRDIDQTDLSMN